MKFATMLAPITVAAALWSSIATADSFPPAGWFEAESQTNPKGQKVAMYLPEGEAVDRWTKALTIAHFPGVQGKQEMGKVFMSNFVALVFRCETPIEKKDMKGGRVELGGGEIAILMATGCRIKDAGEDRGVAGELNQAFRYFIFETPGGIVSISMMENDATRAPLEMAADEATSGWFETAARAGRRMIIGEADN